MISYKGRYTTLMEEQTGAIEKLILSGKKVFTSEDLAVIWQVTENNKLKERIKYYLKRKKIHSIFSGVYIYSQDYTSLDIAQKLIPLSYISLYTASGIYGLTFQHYSTIHSMALKSKKYKVNGIEYVYHKVKESIFYNSLGLINNGRYTITSKERTICDMIYLYPSISFDNLRNIDTEKLKSLCKIYDNKRVEETIEKIIFDINNM